MNDLKKSLIEEHFFRVRLIAHSVSKRLPASVQVDDLVQWGALGLMDAVEKFDPDHDVQFKTYAEWRIRGAMLDGLRDEDHLSRGMREREKLMAEMRAEYRTKFNRVPSDEELAARLALPLDRMRAEQVIIRSGERVHQLSTQEIKAISMVGHNRGDNLIEKIAAMEKLNRIVAGHSPIDRACFILYNVWGFDQAEIAELFGCSFSRISQRIKKVSSREYIELDAA